MKEYAFTKWLVPALQADGTERDMVYNEQMGIFTVRGENQFQKGSIDTQHTVSLLVLKGEISIQTNDKRTVIPAPSYIEFIEPHQWSDLKTDRDFEGCLLITRREIFLQAAECIRSKVAAYVYRHVLEPFIPLEKQDLLRIQSHIDMLRHTLQQKENHFLLEMLENTLRSLILEVWNIILRMYKQENEFEHSFRWKDTLPRFLYLMHTNCRYHHTVKWYADQLYVSPDALSAKLKKLYGKTANQLISESLIEEAKVCLLNPANSVQDVAEKLCFSDQASFSKFFKRYCGVSPGQLKNKPKPYFKGSLPSLPVRRRD